MFFHDGKCLILWSFFFIFYLKHFCNRIIFITVGIKYIISYYAQKHQLVSSISVFNYCGFVLIMLCNCCTYLVNSSLIQSRYIILYLGMLIFNPSADGNNGVFSKTVTVTYSSVSTVPRFVALGYSGYKFAFDTSIYNISVSNIETNLTAFKFLVETNDENDLDTLRLTYLTVRNIPNLPFSINNYYKVYPVIFRFLIYQGYLTSQIQ